MEKKLSHDFIVIEGNIGSGKTSLATKLSKDFNTRLILERFAENPFLPLFYENPVRYAFPLELSFLAERFQQLSDELMPGELFRQQTVSDYLLTKSLIFANNTLRDHELALYKKLFMIINPQLPRPDLLVYLHKDIPLLQKNIRQRGRTYEQQIAPEYLGKLETGYWDYFRQHQELKVLVMDTNEVDFVRSETDYALLLDLIQKDYAPGIHRVLFND